MENRSQLQLLADECAFTFSSAYDICLFFDISFIFSKVATLVVAMKYFCETTNVVSYTDIYAGATSLCKKKYNQKNHTPGMSSCVNHRYKKETRMKYRILWGKSKYRYVPQTKSA